MSIMVVLRECGLIQLSEGDSMAKGLFNLFDLQTKQVSDWFDTETKDELMSMSDEEFINESIRLIYLK